MEKFYRELESYQNFFNFLENFFQKWYNCVPLGHTWVQSFYLFIFQNILYYWKLAFLHLHYLKSRWRRFWWHKSRLFLFFFMPLDLGNCLPKDTILYICLKYFTKSFIFHEEAFFGKKFHETCPKKGMGKFLSCK